MKKLLLVIFSCFLLAGCGTRAFWFSNWDKAETERKQADLLERQTIAIEKIAEILGDNLCKN